MIVEGIMELATRCCMAGDLDPPTVVLGRRAYDALVRECIRCGGHAPPMTAKSGETFVRSMDADPADLDGVVVTINTPAGPVRVLPKWASSVKASK